MTARAGATLEPLAADLARAARRRPCAGRRRLGAPPGGARQHRPRSAVALLGALLGVGLVAVTFNTIRLQILTQRAEIEVAKLIGATDAFIRRPFYYLGLLQGLAGGLVAVAHRVGAGLPC